MEPIISKLQEGVKYPRFERDATRIINDLVTHITQERGIYSSDIEPNPNEHKIWFNTNNYKIYIYTDEKWNDITNYRGFDINTDRDHIDSYPTINILYNSYTGNEALLQDDVYVIIISTSAIERELYVIAPYYSNYNYLNTVKGSGVFVIYSYYGYIYINKVSERQTFENIICKSDNNFDILLVENDEIVDEYDITGNVVVTKDLLEDWYNDKLTYSSTFLIKAEDYHTLILGEMKDIGANFGLVGDVNDEVDIYSYGNNIIFGGDYSSDLEQNIPCYFNTINIHIGCAGKGETLITDTIDIHKYIGDLEIYTGHGRSVNIASDTVLGYTEYLSFIAADSYKYRNDYFSAYICNLKINSTQHNIRIKDYINLTEGYIEYKGSGNLEFYDKFISSNYNDFELNFNADFGQNPIVIADFYPNEEDIQSWNLSKLIQMCKDNQIIVYTTSNVFMNYIKHNGGVSELVHKTQQEDNRFIYITYKKDKGVNPIVASITIPI